MARLIRSGLTAAVVFGCCAAALGQSDSCSTATPISGFDAFPFDLTTATTGAEGQNQAFCNFFAGTGVERDVWFCWTAAEDGQVTISTCGETTADTKIIVYNGCACPAVDGSTLDLNCNDDACSLQTEVTFTASAGNQYLIQLGTSALQGNTAAAGNLVISDPSNSGGGDDCGMPTTVSGEGAFAIDTTGATTGFDGQDFTGCSISGMIHNDQWFCWTPPQDGFYTISTCNSAFDTRLAVYEDFACLCPFAGPIACNDDGCGTQSSVTFGATMFSVYMIQVGNAAEGVGGLGTLDIALAQGSGADECSGAEPITGTGTFAYDTTLATTGFDGQNCDSGTINNDLWYSWTAPTTGVYRIGTCGLTDYDTELAVYEGPTCPGFCLDGDDDSCDPGLQSQVQFNTVQGQVYFIQVGSFGLDDFGPGAFTITEFIPAANDECSTASMIAGTGDFPFDNTTATTGDDGQNCTSGTIASDLWFTWTSPATATYRIGTCGLAAFDTELAVYEGPGCPGICLGGDDDGCDVGLQSLVEFSATQGQVYFIQVGSYGFSTATGTGSFSITELPRPLNDECATAEVLAAGSTAFATTAGATESGTTASCSAAARDVWYRVTMSQPNTMYRAWVRNGPDGVGVAIFDGCPASAGTEIACSADPFVTFDSGTLGEVWVRVAQASGELGAEFELTVDVSPPADECSTAIPVTGTEPVVGTTIGFGLDTELFCGTGDGDAGGVWYSFVGYGSETTITTCAPGTDYDTKLRVFSGTCGALVCEGGDDQDPDCDLSGDASTVTWIAESGVTYYILVHGFIDLEGSYELLFDLGLPTGACCIDGACVTTVAPDCDNRDGLYRGDGTSCTEFTYGLDGDGAAFEDIASNAGATELTLANNSGQIVPIGFSFDFYGSAQTMVGVSDNGYLSFGGALNVATNGTIPSPAGPNGVIAPFWDDLHPAPAGAGCTGMESIRYQTLGSAPNRRFIVQWTAIPQHDFFGRCLDSNTFQAVLFESGAVEFRYGSITPQGSDGDYTVGIEDAAGAAGTFIDGATLASNSSIRFANLSPSTICADAPVGCACETDGTAGVDVFDLLSYLDLWFVSASGADIDGAAGVDVFDLLFFLDCWFPASAGAPCP